MPQIEGWGRAVRQTPVAGSPAPKGSACAWCSSRRHEREVARAAAGRVDGAARESCRSGRQMSSATPRTRGARRAARLAARRAGRSLRGAAGREGRRRALRRATRWPAAPSAVLARAGRSTPRSPAPRPARRRRRARRSAYAASAVYGHPSFCPRGRRHHRAPTARRTVTHLVRAAVDGALAAPAAASSAPSATASATWQSNAEHTTPEADELARVMADDARPRRDARRDGGLVARARARPRARGALPGRRVHEPHPGPPRLPRLDGGYARRQGAASSPSSARGGGPQRGRSPSGETLAARVRAPLVRVSATVVAKDEADDRPAHARP